jgi:hypothetical protein
MGRLRRPIFLYVLYLVHMNTSKIVALVLSVVAIVSIVSFVYGEKFFPTKNLNNSPITQSPVVQYQPYNTDLMTKYISLGTPDTVWPPQVVFTLGVFTCTDTGNEIQINGKTSNKTIQGKQYCVTQTSEGAAGSTYTTYTYTTTKGSELATVSFTLRAVQCMNYDDPKQSECLAERASFDPDTLASHMIDNAFQKHQ